MNELLYSILLVATVSSVSIAYALVIPNRANGSARSNPRSHSFWFAQATIPLRSKKSQYDDFAYGSFEEGKVAVSRDGSQFSLYYRIYNKDSQSLKIPVVVLHGGP